MVAMHIEIIPNRGSTPTSLLRESYRQGTRVRKRTLGNISKLPTDQIEAIRRILKGEKLVSMHDLFEVVADGTRHHGHVEAVLVAMRRLAFDRLLGSRPSRQRDLIVAMVAARVLQPQSKLSTAQWWHTTTLPEILGIADADEEDLYAAMDWVLKRQGRIEKKLARRHLDDGAMALYDLTSSYFEGEKCPLAAYGHNRDGKRGKLQVNYGLLTDRRGCPVSVSVVDGSTGDPTTLMPTVEKLRGRFGLDRFVLVGDRGMIAQKQVDALRRIDGVDWIGALRPAAIRTLAAGGALQMGLFDERNLFEMTHPAFPGERLIACRNRDLAVRRAEKRTSLIEATVKELDKVRRMAGRGRLKGRDHIGVRVGTVITKYKVAKHFVLDIGDRRFDFEIDHDHVAAEAALDGIYVIRTSLPSQLMDADETVRSYKRLSHVERAFRTFKSVDLMVRPIRHRLDTRVRAHIFLCMLAYYVQWHMIEAWRPLLYADADQHAKTTRDPVAAAQRSASALRKARTKCLDDGTAVCNFRGLLAQLSTIARNRWRRSAAGPDEPTLHMDTPPNARQKQAYDLLATIDM